MSNTRATINMPKVSVITPAYNSESYIAETIESIQKQTLDDYEHIIVDDGSTDNTESIVRKYAKKDVRIKLLIQKNSGAAAARNRGIEEATGDYIVFIDSDDFVTEDMLKTLFYRASKYNCDLVAYDKYIFDNNSRNSLKEKWLYKTDSLPMVFCPRQDVGNLTFLFAPLSICIFLDRQFVESNCLSFDNRYRRNEDILFVGKVMALANRASVVKKELYYYRVGNSGNLSSTLDKYIDDGWRVVNDLHAFLLERNLLKGHVKQSFYALSCAVLWHYIQNMKTYEGHKYAFSKTRALAVKLDLEKMKDPGDIYTSINFYKEMHHIIGEDYDAYLWRRLEQQGEYVQDLILKINSLDQQLLSTQKLLDEHALNSQRQQETLRGSPKYHIKNFPHSLKTYVKNKLRNS